MQFTNNFANQWGRIPKTYEGKSGRLFFDLMPTNDRNTILTKKGL